MATSMMLQESTLNPLSPEECPFEVTLDGPAMLEGPTVSAVGIDMVDRV